MKCFEILLGIDFCSKEINFKSFVLIHLRARLGGFNYCTSEDNFQSCYLHLRLPADAYVSVLRIQVHFFIHAPFPKTGKFLTFCFKAYLSLRRPLSGSTITSIFEIGIVLNNVWVLEVTSTTGAKKDHYLLPFGVNLPLGFEFHAVSSLVVSPLRCEGHALEVALLEPHWAPKGSELTPRDRNT